MAHTHTRTHKNVAVFIIFVYKIFSFILQYCNDIIYYIMLIATQRSVVGRYSSVYIVAARRVSAAAVT
jgi:hypothetical protein